MNKGFSIYTIFILSLSLLSFIQSKAQENKIPKMIPLLDASYGMGISNSNPTYAAAFTFYNTHGLLKSKKLRLGYGLRFLGFGSSELNYITAPAKLTSDPLKIDSLVVKNPFTLSSNISFHIEYIIIPKLKVGFNIDVAGIGFGSKRNTEFISSDNLSNTALLPTAKPTTLNLLLIGDRDFGQLGSEFFAAYALNKNFWLRAGMNYTFSEYTTNVPLNYDNDRFRFKAVNIFLGVSYNPFIKS
jgi:hypothetical protein